MAERSEKTERAEKQWYVVRAVSGQEKKVKAYLEKEILKYKLQDSIEEVLTPSEKVYQPRKMKDGKVKKIATEKQLFPGYVFVQAHLNGEVMHVIKNVPGILGFLMVDDKDPNSLPKPMRENEVKRMIGRVSDPEEQEAPQMVASYSVGESVKLIDGPFNGFNGTVNEVFVDKKKLNVIVKIFGRDTLVELNYVQVEKV